MVSSFLFFRLFHSFIPVEGCKRWVLFPYGTCPSSILMQEPQIPSVIWFRDYYDRVMQNKHLGAVEVIQYPGETVYVPAGWPHVVLNLERSVAVTHNYASPYPSMARLWNACLAEHPTLAAAFRKRLQQVHPHLAAQLDNELATS